MVLWVLWMVSWLVPVQGVHVGAALNIFTSFGDLGAVVNVKGQGLNGLPYHHSHSADVFEQVLELRSPFLAPDSEFNGDFMMQLCDNLSQLKAALFLDHRLEGVEKQWQAFTGGWSRSVAAAHLGVNSTYLLGVHSYALVRLTRHHEQVMISPNYDLHLNQWTTDGASKVTPDLSETVFDFINKFGSHYINSYISGESLYQVFVFAPTEYGYLYKAMREYEENGNGLDQVLAYFTPWHAEHIGRIVSLSGNASLELRAERQLQTQMLVFTYSNLLKLHSAPELLRDFNLLMGNDAILAIDLKSLAPFFPNKRTMLWFSEIVDNHLKLWELSV